MVTQQQGDGAAALCFSAVMFFLQAQLENAKICLDKTKAGIAQLGLWIKRLVCKVTFFGKPICG